jgi:hypothetical protein
MRVGISRLFCAIIALTLLALAMPAHAFIYDSFGDGFWTVINNGNGGNLVVNSADASQAVATNPAFQQQFELLYNHQDGTGRLRDHESC